MLQLKHGQPNYYSKSAIRGRVTHRRMQQKIMGIKRVTLRDCFYSFAFCLIITGIGNQVNAFVTQTQTIKTVEAAATVSSTAALEFIRTPQPTPSPIVKIVEVQGHAKPADIYVGEAVDFFFSQSAGQSSEMRMVMHCLLSRESKHGADKGRGDGGLADGALQFHQGTWVRMRNQMVVEGLITEIGNREDLEQSIWTTVWAISKGRGLEWGPLLREARGNSIKACPLPSWY